MGTLESVLVVVTGAGRGIGQTRINAWNQGEVCDQVFLVQEGA